MDKRNESQQTAAHRPPTPSRNALRARSQGQALVIIALSMVVLILFVGLGVDVANLMGKKAKLQSATDASVLSAVQLLSGSSAVTNTAQTKALQMLQTNGILSNTLNSGQTVVNFPGPNQISLHAVQRVDTFFMRLIPAFVTVDISADATADINSYAEINAKPNGPAGVVTELNLQVWGTDSWRRNGNAYSPMYWPKQDTSTWLPPAVATPNPLYKEMPYGYLYRIDVPPSYVGSYDKLVVQMFDPDSYNRPDNPPAWPTPIPCYTLGCVPVVPTPVPDNFASCTNPRPDPPDPGSGCTSNGASYNTAMKLNGFPPPANPGSSTGGRPAFWRVDELRPPYTKNGSSYSYDSSYATTSLYTLWHFNPDITSAFDNPDTLSDQPANATYNCGSGLQKCISGYSVGWDAKTDLRWYQPPGFLITLRDPNNPGCSYSNGATQNLCYQPEGNGGFYFYLYVRGTAGSSENNHDLRVGPPNGARNDKCDDTVVTSSNLYQTDCYVNQLYYKNATSQKPDWNDGGARIFAKRALPLNLDTGGSIPMLFTQVSKNAAGQVLGVRHFDQDCNGGCGSVMRYQMQICGTTLTDGGSFGDDSAFVDVGQGWVGGNDLWTDGTHPDPEPVSIPADTSQFFVNPNTGSKCQSSWLRMYRYPSYSQDTTVWEMPYIRPRLIK